MNDGYGQSLLAILISVFLLALFLRVVEGPNGTLGAANAAPAQALPVCLGGETDRAVSAVPDAPNLRRR
ncbi:MAG: hypothetical protein ACFCUG_10305 [Thiotrichales bacterium]